MGAARLRVTAAILDHLAQIDSALFEELDGSEIAFDGVIDVWQMAGAVVAAAKEGASDGDG